MKSSWLIRFVLALAIAVIPFQGFTQSIVAISCDPSMHGHGADEHAQAHHSADGTHHHPSHAQDSSDDGSLGHADEVCCKMSVSALPVPFVVLAEPERDAPPGATGPSPYSIYIELPHRPPLA